MKLEFTGLNTNQIHDELIDAGIIPELVESENDTTWITIDISKVEAVNAVVLAHDPLKKIRKEKLYELDRQCNSEILAGFFSDADGEMKFYGFNEEDQRNMIATLVGIETGIKSIVLWKEQGGYPKPYTAEQFKQLYIDGFDVHLTNQWVKFHALKGQVDASTTIEQVNGIVW